MALAAGLPRRNFHKRSARGSTEPRALFTNDVRKRLKKLLLLLLGGLLLGCHHSYLLRLVIRTRGSMVWRDAFPCATSWTIFSARTYLCNPTGFAAEPLR